MNHGSPQVGTHKPRPVVKWPGGKRLLVARLTKLVPASFRMYIEPFFGGGALFFKLQPQKAVLADTNADLMNFCARLAQDPERIIARLRRRKNTSQAYYRARNSRPRSAIDRAVRFIYLNRTCFNGLYRTNLAGDFNVPFGDNGRPVLRDPDHLRAAAHALRGRSLLCQDFSGTCDLARSGDFVYLDPPYITAHANNGFVKYNQHLFTWDDQERLARVFASLTSRDVRVLMTNAAHSSIRRLYSAYRLSTHERSCVLSGETKGRRRVRELCIRNY